MPAASFRSRHWSAIAALASVLALWASVVVGSVTAGAQTPPPTTTTTTPPPATTPTSLPRGDGGVTSSTEKGASTTTPAPPPGPTLPDPSGQVRVLLALINVQNAQNGVAPAQQHVVDVEHTADLAAQALGNARARFVQADDAVKQSKERLASLAVASYVDPGQTDLEAAIGGDADVSGKRAVLLSLAIKREQEILGETQQIRTQRQHDVDAAQQQKNAADELVNQAAQGVVLAENNIGSAGTEVQTAIAHMHDGGSGSWSLSIEGPSAVTAQELASWFLSRGQASLAQVPMQQLTTYYISEGTDEGVRGDMAFAQSMVETGSFENPDTLQLNNFAGVGHCDSCASGFDFATPQLGVRGQIQLLKSYAEKSPKYVHPLVDPRLRGPSGCCKTWRQLTKVWATDPNYGPVILEMYRQLLLFVAQQRGLAIPPGV